MTRVVYPDDLKQEIIDFVEKFYKGAFKSLERLPLDLENGSIDVFHHLDGLTRADSGDKKADIIVISTLSDRDGNLLPSDQIVEIVKTAKVESEALNSKYEQRRSLANQVADVWQDQQGYKKETMNGYVILSGPKGENLQELKPRADAEQSMALTL